MPYVVVYSQYGTVHQCSRLKQMCHRPRGMCEGGVVTGSGIWTQNGLWQLLKEDRDNTGQSLTAINQYAHKIQTFTKDLKNKPEWHRDTVAWLCLSFGSIHPFWTLCLLAELGSQRLITVGKEDIRYSLFRKEGKAVHLLLLLCQSEISFLPLTHRFDPHVCRFCFVATASVGFCIHFAFLHTDVGQCAQEHVFMFHHVHVLRI